MSENDRTTKNIFNPSAKEIRTRIVKVGSNVHDTNYPNNKYTRGDWDKKHNTHPGTGRERDIYAKYQQMNWEGENNKKHTDICYDSEILRRAEARVG